ncbi:IclR family transcriptional regulator (plasmid) [Leisingera aquaemixtae]|uniref:HTH-type transcriptional regulator BhcR n=1 Tax=Leisingera aquaemixtae TaxID=1396826 RepID=UPI0021A2BEF7|nr:HTH-type transcriptional regulator BhcR [Leisingera aquaemixtae]UWQ26916.1 IclR family transcriptional regulator [Leisingera aquaemixtae]
MPQAPRRKGRPKNFDSASNPPTIQSLDRALDVLDALAGASGMTLTELSTALDQSAATMYRVLATLEARQIVEMEPQSQTWHIGAMAFRLGSAFLRRSSVIERARPVMRELMEATGETSNLGIERGGDVMFVSQVETYESIRAFFPPGTTSPMHASGIGKALLSCFGEDQLARFLRGSALQEFTEKTLTSADALREDLAQIRRRGWSFDDEEKAPGMRCVAAPVFGMQGEVLAGISVSGPTSRMPDARISEIGALVRGTAEKLSYGLGAPPAEQPPPG